GVGVDVDQVFRGTVGIGGDDRTVLDDMTGFESAFRTVEFEAVAGRGDDQEVVEGAGPGLVGVDSVVAHVPGDQVGHVDGSSEEFDAVVLIGYDFDVFDHRAGAYTAEGQ